MPKTTIRRPRSRDDLPRFLADLGLIGVGVEVGTYEGFYARHVLERWPGVLHCVDPYLYQVDWNDLLNQQQPAMDIVYARALARLTPWISTGRCVLHRRTSIGAAFSRVVPPADWVYLDARHDYDHVLQDLRWWAPTIKPGGLLGGHDYLDEIIGPTEFGVKRAVATWAKEAGYTQKEIHVIHDGDYPSWYVRIHG